MREVAALFVRADSIYKSLPGVDCWDEARDARLWLGGMPGIFHPPCRGWGRLRQFSLATDAERALGPWAIEQVRRYGGVVEHPAESNLWEHCMLPRPGRTPDRHGGYCAVIDQYIFGHRAEKSTWLYIVGVAPEDVPEMPIKAGRPTHCIRPTKAYPRLPSVTHREREETPPPFARWLVELARRTNVKEPA